MKQDLRVRFRNRLLLVTFSAERLEALYRSRWQLLRDYHVRHIECWLSSGDLCDIEPGFTADVGDPGELRCFAAEEEPTQTD